MLVNIISIILNNISQISEELGKFLQEREDLRASFGKEGSRKTELCLQAQAEAPISS